MSTPPPTEKHLRSLWSDTRSLSLGTAPTIPTLSSPPTPLQFLRDFVSPNKPCLISSSSASSWPALSLWPSPSYLSNTLHDHPISLHLTPHPLADSLVPHPSTPNSLAFASPAVETLPFVEALRLIDSTAEVASPFVAYAQQQNDCFREEYGRLKGDVEPHLDWASEALGCLPEAVNLWIGNCRSVTSFHKDHYENLYVVVSGQKHFLLLPPTEVHRMYVREYPAAKYVVEEEGYSPKDVGKLKLELEEPQRLVPWCSVDPYPPTAEALAEQMSSFPLYFNGPKPFECTVNAGEILYLPSMWFHHVRQTPDNNGRTIAINYWYDMQFDIKYAYFNFLQSLGTQLDSKPLELECQSDSEDFD